MFKQYQTDMRFEVDTGLPTPVKLMLHQPSGLNSESKKMALKILKGNKIMKIMTQSQMNPLRRRKQVERES